MVVDAPGDASGDHHPALEGATDTFAIYDLTPDVQLLRIVGTYQVVDGVIEQQAVWDDFAGTLDPPVALRNPIVSMTRDESLTIVGGDGTDNTYRYTASCEPPLPVDGWRRYDAWTASWHELPNLGFNPTSAVFASDGALVGTAAAAVTRYDGDCVPEVARVYGLALSTAVAADDGAHLLLSVSLGTAYGQALPASYAHLAEGPFPYTERPLPFDGRDFVAATDAGGRVAIVTAPGGVVTLVRDTGAEFTSTTVAASGLPAGFVAHDIAELSDGRVAIVGTANDGTRTERIYVVEETELGGGFTAAPIPSEWNAVQISAATEGDDLWIAFRPTATFGGDPPIRSQLALRRGGTWTTTDLSVGLAPTLAVRDGVAHVVLGVVEDYGSTIHYTRVDPDGTITQEIVPPREGTQGVDDPSFGLPAPVAVAPDGTIAVGYRGRYYVRKPGDASVEGTLPLTITINGSGRVTSTDGLVDCTSSCTVDAPYGRRLLIQATATSGAAPSFQCGEDVTVCEVDVVPMLNGLAITVTL